MPASAPHTPATDTSTTVVIPPTSIRPRFHPASPDVDTVVTAGPGQGPECGLRAERQAGSGRLRRW
ncbi:hypothetical protein GCM10010503_69420 [Streptomyces lucensis JCM 4490]|uniref:Uncharacterized protein n=1 Tax=Streptomyces lucensis JCM 4490 TaxID=1306176 RepID=A0A918JLM1_9ACTN|nr:hypothetical protein GCM10010503_69420 [Streptomyces lucensis JCM 4490]